MFTLRPATTADAERIGSIFGAAFVDDPSWTLELPDSASRQEAIAEYYEHAIRERPGHADVAVRDGLVQGAVLWEPPADGPEHPHPVDLATAAASRICSLPPTRNDAEAYNRAVEAARPQEPHWYISDIAAGVEARGTGVGTALLEYRLGRIDRDNPTIVALEATTPASKRLYERHGFRAYAVIDTLDGHASTMMFRAPDIPRSDRHDS